MRTRSILVVIVVVLAACLGIALWTTPASIEHEVARSSVPEAPVATDAPASRELDRPIAATESIESTRDSIALVTPQAEPASAEPVQQLRVRVKDPNGQRVGGVDIDVRSRSNTSNTSRVRTNSNGEIVVDRVALGTYEITALGPRAGSKAKMAVNTMRGVCTDVDLVLEDESTVWAVQGLVVDELGQPLRGIDVRFWAAAKQQFEARRTEADGRFQFASTPCASVVVSIGDAPTTDSFTPSRVEAPFGATDVVFRRAAVYPTFDVSLRAINASSGEEIKNALGNVRQSDQFHSGFMASVSRGVRTRFKTKPGWSLVVRAPGYRTRSIALEELARLAKDKSAVDVALDAGFEEEVGVLDGESSLPISGAAITMDGIAALTDARGRAVLRGASWPKSIHVEREGYVAAEFDMGNGPFFYGEFRLQRAAK